jgi:hypothetical protein
VKVGDLVTYKWINKVQYEEDNGIVPFPGTDPLHPSAHPPASLTSFARTFPKGQQRKGIRSKRALPVIRRPPARRRVRVPSATTSFPSLQNFYGTLRTSLTRASIASADFISFTASRDSRDSRDLRFSGRLDCL